MLTNNSITNATAKDERQLDLRVGISYDADIRQAKSVIENLLIKDECIIKNEQINVFVHELADNAVVLGIRAWVKNEEYGKPDGDCSKRSSFYWMRTVSKFHIRR